MAAITRERLMWLPLLAALYIVALAPWAPVHYVADSVVYVDQADAIRSFDVPSGRYPPGLPITLALGNVAGLEPWQVMKVIAIVLVVVTVVAARRVGGAGAGAVAAILCCASPWLVASSQYVMSESLASIAVLGALLAVLAGRPVWAAVLVVVGILVRLMSVVGIVSLLLSVGRRWVVSAALGAAVLLGAFQWAAYGSPFKTGYETGEALWAPSYVVAADRPGDNAWLVDGTAAKASLRDTPDRPWPNVVAYPLAVLGVTYVFMPPFVAVIGLWALWARRRTAAARFVGGWLAGSMLLVLPYNFQTPRFLAPAMMLLLVYTAAGLIDLLARGAPGDATDIDVPGTAHRVPS